ncbi:MAG: RluA family pseudouridine synthase [Alphaproteobacteria bacterium]|nr:RluA family pseudouridine synthase [Alphaproteobacteria bacterium]MBN2779679.1 RluA family pseudouridine synthase [Alphaproteobacteria bacterium]
MIHKWCRTGQLRVNSKRVKFNAVLKEGDEIRLPPFAPNFKGEKQEKVFEAPILYQDDDVIAFDKPAGWSIQGGDRNILDDLRYASFFPVHRIDAPTQGVVLFAKTHAMAKFLSNAFAEKRIKKTYMALVHGTVRKKRGVISSMLTIKDKSVLAQTVYKVLSDNGRQALLMLRPLTGRKHQLRRHCAEVLNAPILGEYRYAQSSEKTLHLLAFSLSFFHPTLEKWLNIKADQPKWLLNNCSLKD